MRPIDADKLKVHYRWWPAAEREVLDQIVDVQPTIDAVPVIRCKDCWKSEVMPSGNRRCCETLCITYDDDYCSHANTLEEDEDDTETD